MEERKVKKYSSEFSQDIRAFTRELLRESLRNWFKKEKWVRIDTQGNITGPCGTMKKGKATTRCLPRKKAQSLSQAERKASVAKKVKGGFKINGSKTWIKGYWRFEQKSFEQKPQDRKAN